MPVKGKQKGGGGRGWNILLYNAVLIFKVSLRMNENVLCLFSQIFKNSEEVKTII